MADPRFDRAVSDALDGRPTIIGANPQQSEKDTAVMAARIIMQGGTPTVDEIRILARQYLRELRLA